MGSLAQIKKRSYPEDIVHGNIWDLEDYKGKRGSVLNLLDIFNNNQKC